MSRIKTRTGPSDVIPQFPVDAMVHEALDSPISDLAAYKHPKKWDSFFAGVTGILVQLQAILVPPISKDKRALRFFSMSQMS